MADYSTQVAKAGTFARTVVWLVPIVAAYKFISIKLEDRSSLRGRRWNPLSPNVVLTDPRLSEDLDVIRKSVF